MSGDSFNVEGPIAANALTAATTATIARESWADGYVLQYSALDGKLHPVAIPAGPAPSGAANLLYATPDGSSGAASLRALVVADIANGLITNAKLANSGVTINGSGGITGGGAVALGSSLSLSLSAIPNTALANSSVTVSAGTGLSGGGAVALGASVSLAIDSSAVALLSGAQTFTGQKTFPSAGASAVVIPAIRQTSAGNDITVPVASGADSFALLAQSQALTNKTISGSSNTLSNIGNSSLTNSSVTVSAGTGLSGGGSVSLGSSTSLSMPAVGTAGTYAYPTSVTTDDRGRVSAISAGSAPVIGGCAVMLAQVSTNGGAGWIFNGDYFGLSQMIESGRGTPTNVAPWVAPCAGTLKNFRTWTVAAAPSNSNFTAYQAATSSTPTYNATSAVIAIASGAHLGADTTHKLTIAAGDLIIFKTDTSWTNPGFCIQAQFIPSTS